MMHSNYSFRPILSKVPQNVHGNESITQSSWHQVWLRPLQFEKGENLEWQLKILH